MNKLGEETTAAIINAAGKALRLKVNILCLEKVDFNNERDQHVPLGTVLVVPLLLMRHVPIWWMRKRAVYEAARAVVPVERQLIVYTMSALLYREQLERYSLVRND
jgi:hypothetical protein